MTSRASPLFVVHITVFIVSELTVFVYAHQEWSQNSSVIFEDGNAAPNLAILDLSFFHPDTLTSIPTNSLSNVKLCSRPCTWSVASAFLERCTYLNTLHLAIPLPPEDHFTDGAPLVLPTLEVLHVESPFFGHVMATPSLKELYCSSTAAAVRKTAPLPSLHHLALIQPSISLMRDWQPPLSFSEISSLTFDSGSGPEYILEILARRSSGSGDDHKEESDVVFPSLRKLALKACRAQSMSPAALCALALQVLDLRPELHLECDSDFFAPSEMSPYDRSIRYGARIRERLFR